MHPRSTQSRNQLPRASRTFIGLFVAALIGAPAFALTAAPTEARADEKAIDYVDCRWTPFTEAWGCALPKSFIEGRFNAPPEFKHDDASERVRQSAWANAKATPGARSRGRVGVFVPSADGAWLFVPGSNWSPGEIVSLPPEPAPKAKAKAPAPSK
jgi:hypothetical protein